MIAFVISLMVFFVVTMILIGFKDSLDKKSFEPWGSVGDLGLIFLYICVFLLFIIDITAFFTMVIKVLSLF